VEAPGTAPGSDRFITTAIYRHSRQAGSLNISGPPQREKAGAGLKKKFLGVSGVRSPRAPSPVQSSRGCRSSHGRAVARETALVAAASARNAHRFAERTHRPAKQLGEGRTRLVRWRLVCTSNMREREFWLAPQNIRS